MLCFYRLEKKKPKKPHLHFVESHKQNVFALVVFCVVLLRLFQIILTNFSVYGENFKVSFLLEKDGYPETPDTFSDFSRFLRYLCVCVCICMCFVCFQFLWCYIGLRSVVVSCITDLSCQNFCNDCYTTRPNKKITSAFSEVLPSMFLCLFIKAPE